MVFLNHSEPYPLIDFKVDYVGHYFPFNVFTPVSSYFQAWHYAAVSLIVLSLAGPFIVNALKSGAINFEGQKETSFEEHKKRKRRVCEQQLIKMGNDSPNGKACVVLREVTKDYIGIRALDRVSFEIKEGEIFGYIGPNGAGKTTTLKILVGLINDFWGEVQIGQYQLPKQKLEAHKLLGYLPQSVAFQEWRTVNHALKTFGKLSGLTEAEVEDRIPKTLELLGLADVRHKKISQLSGGIDPESWFGTGTSA